MLVRDFQPTDQHDVVRLWGRCTLTRPWNDPVVDIKRKLDGQPDWLLVAVDESGIVGSVMVGYDGHRGWINYLAVDPERQRAGIGRELMLEAERRLFDKGCPKINLQIRDDNHNAILFYESIGFSRDPVASFGKRLIPDTSREIPDGG